MTLREQMDADVSNVFLNTDEHAEDVTYTPKGGAARTIAVIIDEDSQFIPTQNDARTSDMASVFCRRDGSTGIVNPQLGDTIATERNGLSFVWSWAGESADADEFSWWLLFKRTRMERMGSNVAVR